MPCWFIQDVVDTLLESGGGGASGASPSALDGLFAEGEAALARAESERSEFADAAADAATGGAML